MISNVFEEQLAEAGCSINLIRDALHIRKHLPESEMVTPVTDLIKQAQGFDYVVRWCGVSLSVDVKRRAKGASSFWRNGPELALETISNVETGKPGWAVDKGKRNNFVLFVFDPADTAESFMVSTNRLRKAVNQHLQAWREIYFVGRQASRSSSGSTWASEAIFVPASVVMEATGNKS